MAGQGNIAAAIALGFLLVLAAGCAPRAEDAELILTTVPAALKRGETGALEVRMIPNRDLGPARLAARSADPSLSIGPEAYEVGTLAVPRAPASQPGSPPNPPALGLVTIRNFTLRAERPGSYAVTVTLAYGSGSVTRSITVGVGE
ncbi:MAG: hypothetical protein HYR63_17135 [Proteobacteria bacterium]|nr:hypothetical protein [Pseudomonadota bacterium]MBI3499958.1 hypothetical protein [Pseudomonadota bacterium]